ncbi:MAG: hypothetical protein D6712_13810 [Chloroflexi bacterium]|nr:MAG: hypothetical protein D6712_13810 [Chloroflexota bacterium]
MGKMQIRRKTALWVLLLVMGIIGGLWVKDATSEPAITWMHVYMPSYFEDISLQGIVDFYANLRIPIPPVIGLAEILSIRLLGSPQLITEIAYRIALVAVYMAALIMASTSWLRMVFSFAVGMVFLYMTVLIHPGNPQNYDIFFPLFFLLALLSIRFYVQSEKRRNLWAFLGGFWLTMFELTRPFVIFILPFALIAAFIAFKQRGKLRHFVIFLLPVILFSGVWHSYLLVKHRQLVFTNHSGVNLIRAWPQAPNDGWAEEPNNTPLTPDAWPNINTEEHAVNSTQFQQAVFNYWLTQPIDSLAHATELVRDLLDGHVSLYENDPQSQWFGLYRLLVMLTASFVLIEFGKLIYRFVRKRRLSIWSEPDHMLLFVTTATIVLLAIGDRGEYARFLLSVLPFLAALPYVHQEVETLVESSQPIAVEPVDEPAEEIENLIESW